MDKALATAVFESLSSGVRLDAFRLLIKQGPQGMVAGDIGAALGVAPTNMSFHLKAMTHAGLVSATQEGRYQRYRANLPLMQQLIAYLAEECCSGHPELCGVNAAQIICPECSCPPWRPPFFDKMQLSLKG